MVVCFSFILVPTVRTYCRPFTKGYEYLKSRIKVGVPPRWPHKAELSASWAEDEKERVIDILDELPQALLNEQIDGIYRLDKSKDYPNPATNADGIVVLYDSAFDSKRNLGKILGHELAHQNFKNLSHKDRQDYRRATGWHLVLENDRKIYWVGRKEGYVEKDGENSFEEDYANNVEYYLYDSDKLKKATPSAYEWIKRHFGKEFRIKRKEK